MIDEIVNKVKLRDINHKNLKRMKRIDHIVLDIDSTLIDSNINEDIFPRPHLEEFLYFLFNNFKSVSLWTAGSSEWLTKVHLSILKKLLPCGSNFMYMLSCENCTYIPCYGYGGFYCKPLEYLYKLNRDMNSENTLLVDDSDESYFRNRNNTYRIIPYDYTPESDIDDELMGLVIDLKLYNHCNL